MNRSAQKIIFVAFLFLSVTAFRQSAAQNLAGSLVHFTEAEGLPGSQITQVVIDQFGFVWLGTINGASRYDGYEFKRFYINPNDPASIKGLVVWSMFHDHAGQTWIGSSPAYLNRYDPVLRKFRQYDIGPLIDQPGSIESGVNSMCEDRHGRIYFGLGGNSDDLRHPLIYLNEGDSILRKFEDPDSLKLNNIIKLWADHSDNIWILSKNGIYRIDAERKFEKIRTMDPELITTESHFDDLKTDREGKLWLITEKATLFMLDPKTMYFKTFQPDEVILDHNPVPLINSITFDLNGNIWVKTKRGLSRFNTAKGKLEPFNPEFNSQLEKAMISDMAVDSFGSLWIGTANGLYKYEEREILKSFSNLPTGENRLTPGWASCFGEIRPGKLFVTTAGNGTDSGINEIDLRTGLVTAMAYKDIMPGTYYVSGFMREPAGTVLMCTEMGFYRYFPWTRTTEKTMLQGFPDSIFRYINQFITDRRDNLWLCTTSGLYRKEKGGRSFRRYDLSVLPGCNATSNEITNAFESDRHGLWILTNNGLFLYHYDQDNIERHGYDPAAGDVFLSQDINSFYEDPSGIAWVGQWQGGLSRYDVESRKIKTYTTEDGLPSMSVQGILGDKTNKELWLSTFDGLSRFNPETGQFYNFSMDDGIQSQQFADGAYRLTSSGDYIFGGSNGITVFSPGEFKRNSTPPKIFLTDLKLFNQSVVPGKNSVLEKAIYDTREIVLPYNQNTITLEFIALHYSNPAKNTCLYMLENYDNGWRDAGNQHFAFYPRLDPGEYVFRVKAANSNGIWNEEGASMVIVIHNPWWKTVWAYGFYLLLFIGAVYAADRYFRGRLIRMERERIRLHELEQAHEIEKAYHELEQIHETLIATQSKLIYSEKMASLGELTAGIAHEIQNPLNFVNNFAEVSSELVDELKTEMTNGDPREMLAIAEDLKINLEKISHHGWRASSIVKGMLEHSRTSSGDKELTDINALADEYLRLAFHGLRARDKSFNANFKTDFDETIPKIMVIPQDLGRVLLNLINNAFYAVTDKYRQLQNGFEPTVTLATRKVKGGIEIRVQDNGNGIPPSLIDKIFQPFFTTKPAGQGTGLGLSLSFDIVTNGHNGELKVKSKEGAGAEFIMFIPS